MAGCEYTPNPENWEPIVFGSAGTGAAAFGSTAAAAALLAGGLAGLISWPGIAAIVMAGIDGAIIAGFVGFAVYTFNRLFVESPSTITLCGCIFCAGRNTGIPPFADFDWTFNLGGPALALCDPTIAEITIDTIRTQAASGSGLQSAMPIFDASTEQPIVHCEISSNIGNYAAVGTAIGVVAGGVGGAAAGAAVCSALGLATFGIGAVFCLFLLAVAVFLGAVGGGIVGGAVGAGLGWIVDQLGDFNELGESVSPGCVVNFTGRWVTDAGHAHNEIHDIASAQIVECIACQTDATGTTTECLVAAVGIGRHPTGRDP